MLLFHPLVFTARCLERGVAGYCGSSPANSITNLLLSCPGLVGGIPLLLRCLDHLLLQALRLIDAPSTDCPLLLVATTPIRPPLVL